MENLKKWNKPSGLKLQKTSESTTKKSAKESLKALTTISMESETD